MKLRIARKVTYLTDTRGRVYRPQTMLRADRRLARFEAYVRRKNGWFTDIIAKMSPFARFDMYMDFECEDLAKEFG